MSQDNVFEQAIVKISGVFDVDDNGQIVVYDGAMQPCRLSEILEKYMGHYALLTIETRELGITKKGR